MFDRCGGSGDRGVVGDWYEMRQDGMLRRSVKSVSYTRWYPDASKLVFWVQLFS